MLFGYFQKGHHTESEKNDFSRKDGKCNGRLCN